MMKRKSKYSIEVVKCLTPKIRQGYKCLSSTYLGYKNKLKLQCNKGHIFLMSWDNFKNHKQGCSECRKINMTGTKHWNSLSLEYVIENTPKLKDGHKCISVEYVNSDSKLLFECNKGHEFQSSWNNFGSNNCPFCSILNRSKDKHHNWNGGYFSKNLSFFDTYAKRISWCEEIRRNPKDENILQIKCAEVGCGNWINPTPQQLYKRIYALEISGENSKIYCSDKCKNLCNIFGQKKYFKNSKPYKDRTREVQPELRELVLERDNYKCQICEYTKHIECHHFEGIEKNPIESADIDMCIALCRKCHIRAHRDVGCRYVDLRRNKCA